MYRISDADRDQACAELGEHYAVGRITRAEHAERLDRIWAARTTTDLSVVFADLRGRFHVSGRRAPRAHRHQPDLRRWVKPMLIAVLCVVVVLNLHVVVALGLLWLLLRSQRYGGRRGPAHPSMSARASMNC